MEYDVDRLNQYTLGYAPQFGKKGRKNPDLQSDSPIAIRWTANVLNEVSSGVIDGIKKVRDLSGQPREIFPLGSRNDGLGRFSKPEAYVAAALATKSRDVGYGEQVNASEIFKAMRRDPRQRYRHLLVLVIENDMYYLDKGRLIDIHGLTLEEQGIAVLSQRRLVEHIPDNQQLYAKSRQLAMHEGGHLFGLPKRTANTETSLGKHCTNDCVLQQGTLLEDIPSQTTAQAAVASLNNPKEFCMDCTYDLQPPTMGTIINSLNRDQPDWFLCRFYDNTW